MNILIVEDNPDDLELALTALRRFRISNKVDVCRDGEEALAYLFDRAEEPDGSLFGLPAVMLLDLKLPRLDGLDVLKRVKRDERTSHMPVVMMTASNMETDVVESYRLGVNSFIVKPLNYDAFLEAMRAIGYYWLLLNRGPT